MMSDESVGLSEALEALRSDLEDALKKGQGRDVGFRVVDVTLTLEAVAQVDKNAGGKIRWFVFEAGAGGSKSRGSTQTLVLNLTPTLRVATGESKPLDVAGYQAEPGK